MPTLSLLAVLASGCASSALHIEGLPPASSYLQDFEGESASASPGSVRLNPTVCAKADLRQEFRQLDVDDFTGFLKAQGFEVRTTRARHDLVYVDLLNAGTQASVRFRVAILPDAGAAGRDLHVAVLQHGKGSWGVHRSNLAVLAPEGSYNDIVVFAVRTRLACWGVLTLAGLDDSYVIAGGYSEL